MRARGAEAEIVRDYRPSLPDPGHAGVGKRDMICACSLRAGFPRAETFYLLPEDACPVWVLCAFLTDKSSIGQFSGHSAPQGEFLRVHGRPGKETEERGNQEHGSKRGYSDASLRHG